jgi:hypothetical protein
MADYTEADLDFIFNRCRPYPGYPGYAYDDDGNIIGRQHHGKYTDFGWHVDHILPVALGGMHHAGNVRARHWKTNTAAGGVLGGLLNR